MRVFPHLIFLMSAGNSKGAWIFVTGSTPASWEIHANAQSFCGRARTDPLLKSKHTQYLSWRQNNIYKHNIADVRPCVAWKIGEPDTTPITCYHLLASMFTLTVMLMGSLVWISSNDSNLRARISLAEAFHDAPRISTVSFGTVLGQIL